MGFLGLSSHYYQESSNIFVAEFPSLFAQPIDALLSMACSPIASRVLDVILSVDPPSPSTSSAAVAQPSASTSTIPFKARRKLVMVFLDHFTTLVDDKIGSRIADRCWAVADPYLRVRAYYSFRPGPE